MTLCDGVPAATSISHNDGPHTLDHIIFMPQNGSGTLGQLWGLCLLDMKNVKRTFRNRL